MNVSAAPKVGSPVRRRDAEANRKRILAAAAEAFGNEGLGVSMVEIARRAGVGNATVHRNYSCKQQLLEELFEEWFARRSAAADRAKADPDPWHGLVSFLEDAFADGAAHRAAGDLYVFRMRGRERLMGSLESLLVRARDAGVVRADVTCEDLATLMLGVGRTIEVTACVAPQQWRRHLAIVLDGLRPRDVDPLPGLSIRGPDLDAAIREWSRPLIGRDPGDGPSSRRAGDVASMRCPDAGGT